MKQQLFFLAYLLTSITCLAQTPLDAPLPAEISGLTEGILVNHFPAPLYATQDEDEPGMFFWKHNTTILSTGQNLQITEFGAYIFYNNQWNFRASYDAKQLDRWFGTKKGKLKRGQPYTFPDNWRRDAQLRGGWALWYFKGVNEAGQQFYGIGKLETIGELYKN